MARKTHEEAEKAYRETLALLKGGSTLEDALTKTGASDSPFRKWRKKTKDGTVVVAKKPGRVEGRMDIRHLPPRPKKKGKRGGNMHIVDRTSVRSVAGRISYLDQRLANQQRWVDERVELVGVLVKLLGFKK